MVTKVPRFTFEKFPGAEDELTTAMRSVGETMAIGRTFKESLQKGLRSLETGMTGLGKFFEQRLRDKDELEKSLRKPNSGRLYAIRHALINGFTVDDIHEITKIDPWFLRQIKDLVVAEQEIRLFVLKEEISLTNPKVKDMLIKAKEYGFSDKQLSYLLKSPNPWFAPCGKNSASNPHITWLTPARQSSKPTLHIFIPPTRPETR